MHISPMGSGELALLCAAAQPRHPVRQQDETRQGYDRAANTEQEQPPTVDAIALGPIHDVEAPNEIELAPCITTRRPEGTAAGIDVEARRSLVGIGDLPGRKRAAKLGPHRFVNEPRASDRRARSGPCLLYTSPSPRDRQKSRMPSSA